MKKQLRSFLLSMLSIIKKAQPGVHILNGHYLTRSESRNANGFETLLNKMSRYAQFIPIEKAVDLLTTGEYKNVDSVLIAFTFDDGFDDCFYSLAPILEKFDVNACLFVNSGFIEGDSIYRDNFVNNIVLTSGKKPLSWLQVKELHDRGFIIGNHTVDHVNLAETNKDDIESQVLIGKMAIERELGSSCDYFAWPFGQFSHFSEDALAITQRHHSFIFSGCDYKNYFSYNGAVINRRHFEADWKEFHLRCFLDKSKSR